MNQIDHFVKEAEELYKQKKLRVRIVQVAAAILLIMTAIAGKTVYGEWVVETTMQEDIAEQIIRFHVLANSDSEEDQAVKLKVKNEIVSYMQQKLAGCSTKQEAEEVLKKEDGQIRQIATRVLQENGYDYCVNSEFSNVYFPVKNYGDLAFPAGNYDAYRILIGKAEGKNWWCVMFPSLCAVNETYSVVPEESKDTLKHVLTEEEYESIDTEYHFWIADVLSHLF